MSNRPNSTRWAFVIVLAMAALALTSGGTAASPDLAVPLQADVCTWEPLAQQTSQGHFHIASAMDTANHAWHLFGGLDNSNDVVKAAAKVDLSDADITKATLDAVAAGRLDRYGAIGVYRPKGDDSANFWIGGGDSGGDGTNDVQVYNTKAGTWQTVTPVGSFTPRLFHAGAYDPVHDAIAIHGGTTACRADGSDAASACNGANLGTVFLVFDPATDTPSWQNGPSGGPGQVYGHSMVYDSAGQRMLAFGGSTDGEKASNVVWQLDLSDASLSNAKWSQLAAAGRVPAARFLHSAAYDKAKNRMVIYSGVTRSAFTTKENTDNGTYALGLSQTPAVWEQLTPASVQERVGATMAYDEQHSVPVLHGGRRKFNSGGQISSRESYWLKCEAAPPTAVPPPTTVPGGGDTTPIPCPVITSRVPAAAISFALANPTRVQGYLQLQNPSLPPSIWNLPRRYLSMRNAGAPWHPLYNGLIFKAGCP